MDDSHCVSFIISLAILLCTPNPLLHCHHFLCFRALVAQHCWWYRIATEAAPAKCFFREIHGKGQNPVKIQNEIDSDTFFCH